MKIYFSTSLLLSILITDTISKTIYNTKTAVDEDNINLNNFMNLLHNAQIDLKWIRDTSQLIRDTSQTEPNANANSIPNFITQSDIHNLGDKWYKQFQSDEQKFNPPSSIDTQNTQPDNNEKEAADKKPITVPDIKMDAVDVPDNNKNEVAKSDSNNEPKLQDQSETTKNDLSHEANYKLSKYEQEKEEKKRVDSERKLKFLHLPPSTNYVAKRKIDPAEEIRLKIRSRMADRYETFVERHMDLANFSYGDDYDAYLRTHRKIPNYNLFKRKIPESPEQEFKNRKLLDYDYEDEDDSFNYADREQKYRNYFANRDKRQKTDSNKNPEAAVNEMITGILPNKLVKAIFTLAQKNENLNKHVAPNVKISSFVEIKKTDIPRPQNDLKKKANDMIGNIVKSISQLVNEQVKCQTCTPIKPELKQFVNKLLSVRRSSKILSTKFEFPIFSKYQDFQDISIDSEIETNRFVRSLPADIDSSTINNKYNIIRNLQTSFGKLTGDQQTRYNPMKVYIDKHMSLLDELKELSKLSRRNVGATNPDGIHQTVKRDTFNDDTVDEFNPELNMIEIKQPYNDQMTERFIKLSKMVEFMRQNSLLDVTDYDFIEWPRRLWFTVKSNCTH